MQLSIIRALCIVVACVWFTGCGSDTSRTVSGTEQTQKRELINLDNVLKILTETLDELDLKHIADSVNKPKDASSEPSPAQTETKPTGKLDKQKEEIFVKKFAENLNRAHLISEPIGVKMLDEGSAEGFIDVNRNNVKEGSDRPIFKVYIDSQKGRLIAQDTNHGYSRDQSYHWSPGGFFTGMLLGSMISRQFSSGFNQNRFSNMQMSQPGYHGKAAADLAAKSRPATGPTAGAAKPTGTGTSPAAPSSSSTGSSARGSSGSRGFSGGK